MTHLERLNILLKHMESGKLGHKNFDFSIFNDSKDNTCGTNGCMAGELPIVFPNDWGFEKSEIRLNNSVKYYPYSNLMDYFDLEEDGVDHLFYPEMQEPKLYGGKMLNNESTREEVTKNLREFINLKTKQQCNYK